MKLKDSELKSILAEVEAELAALAKSEGATLRKAKDAKDDKDSDEASGSAPAEGSAPSDAAGSPRAEGSAPEASAAPGPEASADSAPEASASAPVPEASASAADPAMEQSAPVDWESLKAEYAALDPESLKAHYTACKAALFEMMGAVGEGSGVEASASAGHEVSASPKAMKTEASASAKNAPANGDAIKKSEAKIADLEAQVSGLTKALELALGTPVRKAVTSVAHLPKTEGDVVSQRPLSKAEVKEKIRSALESRKLSKSEKDKLFAFTLGHIEFNEIKDLLDRR
jgi:hypothetical protein